MRVGQKIAHLLTERKLSIAKMAQQIGVTKSKAQRWVSGDGMPDLMEARDLAIFFAVSLDWLADDRESYPPYRGEHGRPLPGPKPVPLSSAPGSEPEPLRHNKGPERHDAPRRIK